MSKRARLITIPFSHYCEKARWALDYTGVAYDEDAYLPGAHMLGTRPIGARTVPVLVTRHGVLDDSAKILSFADSHAAVERRLYPRDAALQAEVDALERTFNDELGKATRLFGYFHALPNAGKLADLVAPGLTRLQRALFPFAMPMVAPLIRKRYRVDAEHAARARATVVRIFAEVSEKLGSKGYLVGDRFGAADLTFSSLAAASLMPEGHPAWVSDVARMPEEFRAFVTELRATPAGQHALRMYREHRGGRPPA